MSFKKNSNLPAKSCSVFPPVSFLGETKSRRKSVPKNTNMIISLNKMFLRMFFGGNFFEWKVELHVLVGKKSKLSSPYRLADVFRRDSSSWKWSRPNLCFVMFDDFLFLCWVMFDGFLHENPKGFEGCCRFRGQKKTISTSLSLCLAVAVKSSNRHVVVMIRTSMKICFRKVCLLRRFPQYQTGVSLNKSIFRKKMRSQNPPKS